MDFEQLIDDFDYAYEWLITFFYDFFDFINDNKFITAALIITIGIPSIICIFSFFLHISSEFRFIIDKKIKKKDSAFRTTYNSLNKYQKAYLKSLRYDKK